LTPAYVAIIVYASPQAKGMKSCGLISMPLEDTPGRPDRITSSALSTADSQSIVVSVWIAAGSFLVVLLFINRALFTTIIHAYSDFAANALQIDRAKRFHELLGNYSRWGFHHPGPAFMYIFALGEALFRDLLHLVPGEMNAHILTAVLFNTAFLFGTIAILARHCRSRLFVPAALAVSLFFIDIVNRAIPGAAMLSIWMPHVLMFCFLFFAAVCASVAVGEISKLPLLALSGLMLIHGHAAQPLFVGALSLLAIITVGYRRSREVGLREFLRLNRRPIALSVLLAIVFATPVVLDVVLHKPSNVDAILFYNAHHQGIQNHPGVALKYEASFLIFEPNPEVVLQAKSAHLLARGFARKLVPIEWLLGALLLVLAIGMHGFGRKPIMPFLGYLGAEIALVAILFYFWTLKMSGPLFNFNGYFIYGMQLLALLVLLALVLDGLRFSVRPAVAFVLCALLPLSLLADKPNFTNALNGDPETDLIIANLPANLGMVHLTFAAEDWLTIVGVANWMKHQHRPFCVDDVWSFTFGKDNLCPASVLGLSNLILTHAPRDCKAPCRVLAKSQHFETQLEPYPWLKIPLTIKPDDISSLNKGFFGSDNGPVWSSGEATVYFLLATDCCNTRQVRVTIPGMALPGRPAQFALNGHPLGSFSPGQTNAQFVVDRGWLLPAAQNTLAIRVENAGTVGDDSRPLGFYWGGLQLDLVQP
jgi:hypothetical protein